MMRKLLLVGVALTALSLTGCDIYFGPSSNSDCGVFEPCDDTVWPDEPPPAGTPGGVCSSDYECNAGCFCQFADDAVNDPNATGTCVETGFCDGDLDCPTDFVCQLDRATCAPETLEQPPPTGNCDLIDCAAGTVCDPATGQCIPTNGCVVDSDCGAGFECDDAGLCQPLQCATDGDCLEGCACATDTGVCEETGFCLEDADCVAYCTPGTQDCEPTYCDQTRNTCTFEPPQVGTTCGGSLTCAQPAPPCLSGEAAEVVDGCYTGQCVPVTECTDTPLATCDRIQNVNQCINRPDCVPDYEGMDCTCGGQSCDCANPPVDQNGDPLECTCSIWVYSCESI